VDVPADFLYPAGQKTITTTAVVDNLAGPDPNAGNDSDSEDTLVITKADVKIASVTTTSPLEVMIGTPAQATLDVVVENGGPSSPVDTVLTGAASAGTGAAVAPATTSADQTALAVGTPQTISQTFTLTCTTPGFKTISFQYTIALKQLGRSTRTRRITQSRIVPDRLCCADRDQRAPGWVSQPDQLEHRRDTRRSRRRR
jgi:hypothetical protein